MTRASNPEIPGGSIARVAINNKEVQEPPTSLSRRQPSREKQVAFNKSVLINEEDLATINSGLSGFLMGMSLEKRTVVCEVHNRYAGSCGLRKTDR
jgi:hypothetical protein